MKASTTTAKAIDAFFRSDSIACVGVSRSGKKFGDMAFRTLKNLEYNVVPIHPEIGSIGKTECYSDFTALPTPPEGVFICTRPAGTEAVVREALDAGASKVWIQQGAESTQAVSLCAERGASCITGECILMHAKGSGAFHSLHRMIRTLLGGMPR